MIKKLVSVVMVSFNSCYEIREAIESVIPFLDQEVELIVIDGGSTDGTCDVLNEYIDHFSAYVSEPDMGIYHAMNKGINLSVGRFIIHINCGDKLLHIPKEELKRVNSLFACCAFPVKINNGVFYPSCGSMLTIKNTLHHQGCFYQKDLMPYYDLRYKVFADYDLNIRLKLMSHKFLIGTTVVASHSNGGISNTTHYFNENYRIISEHYGIYYVVLSYFYFKLRGFFSRLHKAILL
jgi:glycosyltransferase involved in cell wall biosynthesis